MPVITFQAVNRGYLISGHSAGGEYQLENQFTNFSDALGFLGTSRKTLDGTPETYLYAVEQTWRIQTDLIYAAAVPNWREFFSSVLAKETFQIDFTGTIASPGTDIDVYLVDDSIPRNQRRGDNASYAFTVRKVP